MSVPLQVENPWKDSARGAGFFRLSGERVPDVPKERVAHVVAQAQSDLGAWDGYYAAIVMLDDDTFAAWDDGWGPTGSGFHEDAYGGNATVYIVDNVQDAITHVIGDDLRGLIIESMEAGGALR